MTNRRFFVIDTSSLVSAIVFENSIPRQAFETAAQKGIFLLSNAVADELSEVLKRKKFDKYISLENRLAFLSVFVDMALFVNITETITDCRDPKDNKFLELAISGRAEIIISSDQDLLELHPFRNVTILTPRAFVEQETSS